MTEPSMRVYYLAGPMAGYPEHNHPAFHQAAAELRGYGYKVINPAEYGNLVTGWVACMKRDIHALLWCDSVAVLPGWQQSKGGLVELSLACDLLMPVYEVSSLYPCLSATLHCAPKTIEPEVIRQQVLHAFLTTK